VIKCLASSELVVLFRIEPSRLLNASIPLAEFCHAMATQLGNVRSSSSLGHIDSRREASLGNSSVLASEELVDVPGSVRCCTPTGSYSNCVSNELHTFYAQCYRRLVRLHLRRREYNPNTDRNHFGQSTFPLLTTDVKNQIVHAGAHSGRCWRTFRLLVKPNGLVSMVFLIVY